MNCSDILELAPLWFTRELDRNRAHEFSQHLAVCGACRQELAEQAAFDELLRTAAQRDAVDSTAVVQHVRGAMQAQPRAAQIRKRWILAAAGIAALLIFGIAGYQSAFSLPNPAWASAAFDHRLEIVQRQPREWFSDAAVLRKIAAQQKLPAGVVSAFMPAGYHLARGKLCFVNGQLYLHLVYENQAGAFSLYLRRIDTKQESQVRSGVFGREAVAGFQRHELAAMIVSNDSRDTTVDLARSAAAVL